MYDEVVVPEAVYEETVIRGLERGYRDAERIERAVCEGLVCVRKAPQSSVKRVAELFPELGKGEVEILALALELSPCHVIVDDRAARIAARLLGLESYGTIFVLARAVSRGLVSVDEALGLLDALVSTGFRLSVEVYLEARRMISSLGKDRPHATHNGGA